MEEKKYKVLWCGSILAHGMRLDDALLFIKAFCEKNYENKVMIELWDDSIPDSSSLNKGV